MGTYMGNVGHLMQHWTLCEILNVANKHVCGLNYIDAHAMAPWATIRTDRKINRLDAVRRSLSSCPPGQNSVYERAWSSLAHQQKREGYPSSAAFVRQVWDGHRPYSMLLCENNLNTAAEIAQWIRPNEGCLFRGDWRKRFDQERGLPNSGDVGLKRGSLTLVSFDPNLYSIHRYDQSGKGKPKLYREDLVRTLGALERVEGPVIIQLSTYTNNGGNRQQDVIDSANSVLTVHRFALPTVVKVNLGNNIRMMSLVYARGKGWAGKFVDLPNNFQKWLSKIPKT